MPKLLLDKSQLFRANHKKYMPWLNLKGIEGDLALFLKHFNNHLLPQIIFLKLNKHYLYDYMNQHHWNQLLKLKKNL